MSLSPPFRLLRVIARLNIGGPAIHAVLLTQGLNPVRFQSTLVAGRISEGEGDMGYFADAHGVKPRYLSDLGREIGAAGDVRALQQLIRLTGELTPAIVHTHTAKAGAVGRLAAMLCRVPVIVHTFHGHVFEGYFGPVLSRAFVAIERALASRSSCLIAVGEPLRRELVERYRIAPAAKVRVIRLGFSLEPFRNGPDSGDSGLRRELGLTDEPTVGIVGRLVGVKNHELFLEAAVRVSRALPRTRFVIVGDGPLRDRLEARAHELGLDGRVHFVGWKRNMPEVYRGLDVVALTSKNEGTPVALIEAQASGVPVVSTDVGGVSDAVQRNVTGWLVPQDAWEIAREIAATLESPERRNLASAHGYEFARARFSRARLLREVEALYEELLEGKG